MKKIFGALLIAVCIGMAMPAQAQIHFGVKGGLNLSKASFSNVKENFKKDNFTGFFIGPMALLRLQQYRGPHGLSVPDNFRAPSPANRTKHT